MPRAAERFLPLLIVGAVVLAYAGSLHTPFLFDDTEILENDAVHALSAATVRGTTRPLVQLSFALNWALGHADVVGYHLVNVGVHALAALVLYAVAARTLRATGLALAIALLWALHPLQTESVTYVIQRAESLMGLCYLLTLWAVVRGAGSPHPTRWHAGAIAACALGMLCKPVMVTAPLVVAAYDRVFLAGSWARVWRERRWLHAGLFATLAILLVLLLGQENESTATAGFAMRDVSLAEFARSQPGVILHYLRLAIWPRGLVLDYAWPPATGVRAVVVPTVVLLGGVAALLVALRGRPRAAFLVWAFLLLLAPSSSVVPIRDLAFEHRMYLPLAPLVALAVAGGWSLVRRTGMPPARARALATGSVAVAVVALAAGTIARNDDYRSPIAMWTDVTTKHPANVRAFANLAQALLAEHRVAEAAAAARTALTLDPSYADAHVHLGHALAERGDFRAAEAQYAEAVRLKPTSAEAHNNWGATLADQRRYAEAEPHYREALRLRPSYAEAKNNLAVALMERGDYAEAAALYREALRLAPDYAEPHSNLGNLLARQGRTTDAIAEYERALALRPDYAEVHFNLALALAAAGRHDEAAAHAATALRLRPDLAPLVQQAGLRAAH